MKQVHVEVRVGVDVSVALCVQVDDNKQVIIKGGSRGLKTEPTQNNWKVIVQVQVNVELDVAVKAELKVQVHVQRRMGVGMYTCK